MSSANSAPTAVLVINEDIVNTIAITAVQAQEEKA